MILLRNCRANFVVLNGLNGSASYGPMEEGKIVVHFISLVSSRNSGDRTQNYIDSSRGLRVK